MVGPKLGCALAVVLLSTGCEAIASFDPKKLETDRTIGPVPIPDLDGSTPRMPEAGQQDAAIPGSEGDAAVVEPGDMGGLDAAVRDAAAQETDAGDAAHASPSDASGPGELAFEDAAID